MGPSQSVVSAKQGGNLKQLLTEATPISPPLLLKPGHANTIQYPYVRPQKTVDETYKKAYSFSCTVI